MCACLNATSGAQANNVANVLNVLLGTSVSDTTVKPNSPLNGTCKAGGALYSPVGGTYVCSKTNAICPCPATAVGTWNSSAGNDCRDFVANVVDKGVCLPATVTGKSLSEVCRMQNCQCEEQGSLPDPSPSPSPAASPSPSPQLSPSPSPTVSPSPSPAPSPQPGTVPCEDNTVWSLSYSQGWWTQSFCDRGPGCANKTACSLQVPPYQVLPANLKAVLASTGCPFTTTGATSTDTRNQMCSCIKLTGGERDNQVAFVFNVLLSNLDSVTNPSGPTNSCGSGAAYSPLAETYVCNKGRATCSCPTNVPVGEWGASVSKECREWVNDGPAHEGKCLPSPLGSLSSSCQMQSCACEAPASLPSPSPSPKVSPSPSPKASPSPSPDPSPAPGAVPCEDNTVWSLSYSQGWWTQSFCDRGPGCANKTACSLQVPPYQVLPANLKAVLASTGCPFTTTGATSTDTRNQMCSCIKLTGGERDNQVAFVFNVLLSNLDSVTSPSGPTNSCGSGAAYSPLAETYVCNKGRATCSCPTNVPVGEWGASVSKECREWVNDGPAHEGKCLPSSLGSLSSSCQMQSCAC